MRRTAAPLLALIAVLAAVLAGPASPARARTAAAPHRPVILVHGYNADPGVWGGLDARLRAAGYTDGEIHRWGYDTHQSVNEVLAGRFAAYVDDVRRRTGADTVDIVAHSYGSLPTRWYLKYGGGTATVAHWISLGGPNHGTSVAWACALWDQACRDMTPGSWVQKRLAEGDETPGAVAYTTFWSGCDEVINPDDSVPLTGADNRPEGCLDHNALLGDETVGRGVLAALTG
ncbi:esterase/lipase family protein [Streptomyces sp. NPDC056069]|uniref:esterase/lipase family protein n=1 Tax=Streptomyces sp. NPDC056069 TaxID=3345702 RepID=UPI0035DC9C67